MLLRCTTTPVMDSECQESNLNYETRSEYRDLNPKDYLGKVTFYRLNYIRVLWLFQDAMRLVIATKSKI